MTDVVRHTLAEAIELMDDGASVALGLALEHAIPFAVGHELIRQRTSDLTLIGPISDMLFDQLVGAGVVGAIRAAWVGNVSVGSGYRFRAAVESGDLEVENHSNFSIALALHAGALGVPSVTTKSLLGSDILEEGPFEVRADPRTDEPHVVVPAIRPDWAIVHAQRASPVGDVHLWGNTGLVETAVAAAEDVLVTVEELVPDDAIRSDPSRVAIPRDQVTALVECPFGAHPSPVAGYYRRDHDHFIDYADRTTTEDGFDEWAQEWVSDIDDRADYVDRIEADLEPEAMRPLLEVTYGT